MTYPPPPSVVRPMNTKASWALWLGLGGLVLSWCTLGAVSVLAVVLGHQARRELRANPGQDGAGRALAGLCLGYPVATAFGLAAAMMVADVIRGR